MDPSWHHLVQALWALWVKWKGDDHPMPTREPLSAFRESATPKLRREIDAAVASAQAQVTDRVAVPHLRGAYALALGHTSMRRGMNLRRPATRRVPEMRG